jgi:GGDEF domain-containing protein
MVIAEQFLPEINGFDVLRMLKTENVYRQICAVLLVKSEDISTLPDTNLNVDELVILPTSDNELNIRMRLALYRTTVNLDANPLTRLPGNTSIINTVQRLASRGEEFALAYADMDNFKPYNDRYGFSRGDEVILMAARIIANVVSGYRWNHAFVGHVGGDDFVFLLPLDVTEDACKRIVQDFDTIVPSFYDPEDRTRGYIFSYDRQGRELVFPILSISIAVVPNTHTKYTRYAQLAHVAGQLKQVAKATPGSTYVIDRRQR